MPAAPFPFVARVDLCVHQRKRARLAPVADLADDLAAVEQLLPELGRVVEDRHAGANAGDTGTFHRTIVRMTVADYTGRTAWSRTVPTPLREFLRKETGSAVLLLAATVATLLWVNVDSQSYSSLWTTRVSIEVGDSEIALDLRG
jgi:hypothetical protein